MAQVELRWVHLAFYGHAAAICIFVMIPWLREWFVPVALTFPLTAGFVYRRRAEQRNRTGEEPNWLGAG